MRSVPFWDLNHDSFSMKPLSL